MVAGAAMLGVYVATLAPGVTLWDAGEFATAAESLGIPHPPGTPLYVLVARTWRVLLPIISAAEATNLLAAVATAAACGIVAGLMARWTRDTWGGVAAGLAAGGVSTVWRGATETEVYSLALLLSMAMVWAGDAAGRAVVSGRRVGLVAYLMALAPPLHLSALVAAPAAWALGVTRSDLRFERERAITLGGGAMLVAGIGTVSVALAAAGVAAICAGALMWGGERSRAIGRAAGLAAVVALGCSAFAFLPLRAAHDPVLNQGNPATWSALWDLIARRQYDVPSVWPRQAPLWLQVGNLVQYADWQIALGLDDAVGASPARTPLTVLFVAFGVAGSAAHRRSDRRSWFGMLVLLAAATVGVVVYLNLKAGPSYGHGVLPPDAEREARERDYFFALGFMTWGAWAGYGAVAVARAVARRFGGAAARPAVVGVAVAALPVALNWGAANRRREPAASLPGAFAQAMLHSVPPHGVLFVAGDNDTYPLWYVQVAEQTRRDVTVVTVPLLGARWYRAELARRDRLYDMADTARWRGTHAELAGIARRALGFGRPIAASVALGSAERAALGRRWRLTGLVYILDSAGDAPAAPRIVIDAARVDTTLRLVGRLFPVRLDDSRVDDPTERYLIALLRCPALAKGAAEGAGRDSIRLLDSRCNFP